MYSSRATARAEARSKARERRGTISSFALILCKTLESRSLLLGLFGFEVHGIIFMVFTVRVVRFAVLCLPS